MASDSQTKSWWETVPGVLTGLASVVVAATGLYVVVHKDDGTRVVKPGAAAESAVRAADCDTAINANDVVANTDAKIICLSSKVKDLKSQLDALAKSKDQQVVELQGALKSAQSKAPVPGKAPIEFETGFFTVHESGNDDECRVKALNVLTRMSAKHIVSTTNDEVVGVVAGRTVLIACGVSEFRRYFVASPPDLAGEAARRLKSELIVEMSAR